MNYLKYESPIGILHLVASDTHLLEIGFDHDWAQWSKHKTLKEKENPVLKMTVQQLKEYFAGKRTEFDIPLDPPGTEFQKKAWQALVKIPWGKTISYGEQARTLKQPNASRAVGAANGRNPIPIVIPCHRVIGKNGSLTGYAGGLDVKKKLLKLEGIL